MFLVVADQLSLLRLEADQTVRALEAFVQVIFQAEYVLIAKVMITVMNDVCSLCHGHWIQIHQLISFLQILHGVSNTRRSMRIAEIKATYL